MKTKLSLVKIVKQPLNKNCWLAVEDHVELKIRYTDCIVDYDFIDFEGEVFYYDVLDSIQNCFTHKLVCDKRMVISDVHQMNELLNFVSLEWRGIFSERFFKSDCLLVVDVSI